MAENTFFWAGLTVQTPSTDDHIFRPNGNPGWVIHYTIKGESLVGVTRPDHELRYNERPGDLLIIPPYFPHDYTHNTGKSWSHYYLHFSNRNPFQNLSQWPSHPDGNGYLHAKSAAMRRRLEYLFSETTMISERISENKLPLLFCYLKSILLWCDTINPLSKQGIIDERVKAVQDFILDNYTKPLSLADIAASSHLSVSRLSCIFKKALNVSPMQYLEQIRIEKACNMLLSSSRQLTDIAIQCGYENPLYFSRVFRKITGICPSRYRQQHGFR